MDEFPYLGSVVISGDRIDAEVDRRLAGASQAFGALCHAVFNDSNFTITTKHKVYQSCILSVHLYGCECLTTLHKQLNMLNAFHHQCIRTVLGITTKQQWEQHIITSGMTSHLWGDLDTVADKITKRRLEWLGNIARMPEYTVFRRWLCLDGCLRLAHLEGHSSDGGIRSARI